MILTTWSQPVMQPACRHFISPSKEWLPYQRNYLELCSRTIIFGNHLDENGKAIDIKELENFQKAGQKLSETWLEMVIYGYQVSGKWVDPSDESKVYHCFTDPKTGADWLEPDVFISKYCLQITKCNNLECCQPMHNNVQEVLHGKFLPTTLALSDGPYLINPSKNGETKKNCIRASHCSSCDQRVTRNGDIQLLRSHLGGMGEGGHSKCERMPTGGWGVTSMRTFV